MIDKKNSIVNENENIEDNKINKITNKTNIIKQIKNCYITIIFINIL
jgi:hypothetical protein